MFYTYVMNNFFGTENFRNFNTHFFTMDLPPDMDNEFIRKLTGLVLSNIGDEHFGVEALTSAAKMSRSHIQRRLKEIANTSVSQFIHKIRLEKAMYLLIHEDCPVSEIAFRVGFSSPAYFNYSFRRFYGFPPGEARKRIHNKKYTSQPHVETPARGFLHSISRLKFPALNFFLSIGWKYFLAAVFILFFVIFLIGVGPIPGLIKNVGDNSVKSIIVLPFKDMSYQSEFQYFADGLTEDILNKLVQLSGMQVVSRTTSEHFSRTDLTVREIARKINVRYVMEGSVRFLGEKVRISVQLIDARDDNHIWAGNFDRDLTDLMGVQSDIAITVAEKLESTITADELRRLNNLPEISYKAYDFYMKGRFLLNKANSLQRADINKADLEASIACFEKAIGSDSTYAPLFAGLAEAWFQLSAWGWYQPYYEGIEYARRYSGRALALDPDCAEAHAVKAHYLVWPERRFEEGRSEFITALELDPYMPLALQGYAQLLMITGPIEDARRQINRSLEIEPHYWVIQNLNAWIYYFEQEYKKAISACETARDLNAGFTENKWLFFLNYARMGDGEKAIEALTNILKSYPQTEQFADQISTFYAASGIRGLFTLLIEINSKNPVPVPGLSGHPFYLGWWYALEGNKKESVAWLVKNYSMQRRLDQYFNLIATNPDFDILRDDPQFVELIENMGLAQYHRRPVTRTFSQ